MICERKETECTDSPENFTCESILLLHVLWRHTAKPRIMKKDIQDRLNFTVKDTDLFSTYTGKNPKLQQYITCIVFHCISQLSTHINTGTTKSGRRNWSGSFVCVIICRVFLVSWTITTIETRLLTQHKHFSSYLEMGIESPKIVLITDSKCLI